MEIKASFRNVRITSIISTEKGLKNKASKRLLFIRQDLVQTNHNDFTSTKLFNKI